LDFELSQNAYRARALARFDWLEHGFGTRFFDPPEPLATLHQIHSDVAIYATQAGCLADGDAILSDTPGHFVAVKTADCVPILVVDVRHRSVAAVHAGWRGTVAGVVPSTLTAMAERWDTQPADLHAAIGPGIGQCCFEVGPEVAVQFGESFQRTHVNLEQANRRQLVEAGLAPERIYTLGFCTFCRADQFHSFRRDGEKAGRMFSVIGVKTPRARD
jgi:purine-nucleoside/S-methyl-5'-thioadenosine phosphorylase / adenosine deaminase